MIIFLKSGFATKMHLGVILWLLLLWLSAWLRPAQGGRVLVMPVEGSHWLSMKVLATGLAQRGHNILVLVPETNILIQSSELFRTETFPVKISKEELSTSLKGFQEGVFKRSPALMDIVIQVGRLLNFTGTQVEGCESLLYNEPLMQKLKEENFDVVLTDPFLPCGPIIATALGLPAVYFLRGIPCGLDMLASQCPSPPSYVPRFQSGSTDKMTFVERIQNFVMSGVELVLCRIMYASFDELASRYLDADVTYQEIIGRGAIWLLRYDFTFEYPRPLMPNMVLIGGINCRKSAELSAEVEEFVKGSGEHGIVVFSLGSLVSSMPKEKAAIFFKAFSMIPQRVLWRYTGEIPDDVPENVKRMKWLPQNDLLGHPKAKAFITHGGTHGIYEGICHGVPMVMLPLFGDQGDNVHRVATRGVGVVLSIHDITAETLVDALNTVINDSSYKQRMEKLSAIHNDRPMQPLDLAVYWTEFVMRHKGADHLRPAAHDLNWLQYHSLDVIGFLLFIVLIVTLATFKCCALCWRRCCRKSQKRKED
uniref:UDP-glucuronosyltransferase n=1 Tax=Sinocyclocheilus rhinocerous TaxID=307959 RepID=A0A673M262_9TELE